VPLPRRRRGLRLRPTPPRGHGRPQEAVPHRGRNAPAHAPGPPLRRRHRLRGSRGHPAFRGLAEPLLRALRPHAPHRSIAAAGVTVALTIRSALVYVALQPLRAECTAGGSARRPTLQWTGSSKRWWRYVGVVGAVTLLACGGTEPEPEPEPEPQP